MTEVESKLRDLEMHQDKRPWDTASEHARVLERALLEWGWIEGSCNGDWSEKSIRLQSLHDLAERIKLLINQESLSSVVIGT